MANVPFTDLETNEGKPHRHALWKKIFDNDADRELQIKLQEGLKASIFVDHFDWTDSAINFNPGFNFEPHSSKWSVATEGMAQIRIPTGIHAVETTVFTSPPSLRSRLRANYRIQPSLLPSIKFRTLFQYSPGLGAEGDIYWGAQSDRPLITKLGSDAVLLWFNRANAGLKFIVKKNGGAETVGTADIEFPLEFEWFNAEIRYVDTDTVECFFNGALIETFNGPGDTVPDSSSDQMFPEFHAEVLASPTSALRWSCDWIDVRNTLIEDVA